MPKSNINDATEDDIEDIEGIGPTLAERIYNAKPYSQATFKTQLESLKGIGEAKAADVMHYFFAPAAAKKSTIAKSVKSAAASHHDDLSAGMSALKVEDIATELFHQTDETIANIILRTQQMKPGTKGLAGGGIYFATNEELTAHKAHAHGVILKAYVSLGKILTLEADGDPSMTLRKLNGMGYDSVCIARKVSSGQEYVVYEPSRVLKVVRA